MTNQIATYEFKPATIVNVGKFRKDKGFTSQLSLCAIVDGRIKEVAIARFYNTKSSTYCCLWINTDGDVISSGAMSNGYGYHRASDAFELAAKNAGIKLSQPISGRGDQAVEDALTAVGVLFGHSNTAVIDAHA